MKLIYPEKFAFNVYKDFHNKKERIITLHGKMNIIIDTSTHQWGCLEVISKTEKESLHVHKEK